jgi:hypothetical protein
VEGSGRGKFKALSWHCPGETDESRQSGYHRESARMQVTSCGSGKREVEERYFSLFQTGPGAHPASLATHFTVELTQCLTNKQRSTKTYGGVNV